MRAAPALRVLPLLVLALLLAGGGLVNAQSSSGASRADPIPFGKETTAGPLRIAVLEVVTGANATDLVVGAGGGNVPPREGVTYVAVRLRAANDGDRPVALDGNDFALTGASGLVRRFVGAGAPDPPLDGVVAPGETREGWVVLAAATDETNLLLVYDSLTLGGRWADRVLALEAGAAVADADAPLAEADEVATDPSAPAGIGEPFTTDQWQVELLDVASCSEVYDMSDFRVRALPPNDPLPPTPWLALYVRITNVAAGGEPGFVPVTAFMLAEEDGSAASDVLILTAPYPDAGGSYYPGASREGWMAFELPEPYVAGGSTLVRFLPYRDDTDARYVTFADEGLAC